MKSFGKFTVCFLGLLLLILWIPIPVTGSEAASKGGHSKIRWSLLPRVSKLNPAQREALFEELKKESGYGGCKDTIIDCLYRTKPDKTAVRITNFGAHLLSKGVPPMYLGPTVKERAKFANTQASQFFTFEETPVMGNEHAPITIIEFAEFKCPYCVTMGPLLKKLVEESHGTVRLLFKHFPLKQHQGAALASRAAQAAHRQGKFWGMYELLFKNMNNQAMEDLMKYAQELGLDLERFKGDMDDNKILQILERDKMEGIKANLAGTPTLFINAKYYNLRYEEDFLKDVINEEAERLRIKPPYEDWTYQ